MNNNLENKIIKLVIPCQKQSFSFSARNLTWALPNLKETVK